MFHAGLEGKLWSAFRRLLDEDLVLFASGVSERTLCGRLAIYLQQCIAVEFPDHRADVEYNRTFSGEKRIPDSDCTCADQERRNPRRVKSVAVGSPDWGSKWDRAHNRVTADLVVHSRGLLDPQYENLIAVEMKKSDANLQDCDFDRCRLRRMTLPWYAGMSRATGYTFAFFVCLRATNGGASRDRQFETMRPIGGANDYQSWPGGWGYVETFAAGRTIDVAPFRSIPVDRHLARDVGF